MGQTIRADRSSGGGGGGAVDSFNGRTGAVAPKNADYNTGQVTEVVNKKYVTDAEKLAIANTSGTNTGDETTSSIQTKRPLKTVNGTSLEGLGNVVIPTGETYSKIVVFEDTPLNNFNSNVFTDVAGMQITIDRIGDYTFSAFLNCNNDQSEEIDLTIALTPITNRVITLPDGSTVNVAAGTQFTSQFQAVRDRQQKNSDQTLTGLFLFDDLEINDLIDFQINTRNDNVDLSNRRAYGYTIN